MSRKVCVHATQTGKKLHSLAAHKEHVIAICALAKSIAVSVDKAGQICVWNFDEGSLLGKYNTNARATSAVATMDNQTASVYISNGKNVNKYSIKNVKKVATSETVLEPVLAFTNTIDDTPFSSLVMAENGALAAISKSTLHILTKAYVFLLL